MKTQITQRQLRNDSGEIMRRLDRGEAFVVTRSGVPVGELTPYSRRQFIPAALIDAVFSTAPSLDLERLRHEIDELVDQTLDVGG